MMTAAGSGASLNISRIDSQSKSADMVFITFISGALNGWSFVF
jgi:hypothetical protein